MRGQFLNGCREIERLARAEGVPVADDIIDRIRHYVAGIPGTMRSSLLSDLSQGKRTEVEALHGSVVRRAASAGVDVPIISTLYAVLKPWAQGPPENPLQRAWELQQAHAHAGVLIRVLGVVHREKGVAVEPGEATEVRHPLDRAKPSAIGQRSRLKSQRRADEGNGDAPEHLAPHGPRAGRPGILSNRVQAAGANANLCRSRRCVRLPHPSHSLRISFRPP